MALGQRQVGLVRGEEAPTGRTAMCRVANMEVNRSAALGVTEIMNGSGGHSPAAGAPPTEGTASAGVVAAATHDTRLGKILDPGDSFGDIGHIDAWPTDRSHLLTQ